MIPPPIFGIERHRPTNPKRNTLTPFRRFTWNLGPRRPNVEIIPLGVCHNPIGNRNFGLQRSMLKGNFSMSEVDISIGRIKGRTGSRW